MPPKSKLLLLLLSALNARWGVIVSTSSPTSFEQTFNKTIKENALEYPDLPSLTYRPSPHSSSEFWVFPKRLAPE